MAHTILEEQLGQQECIDMERDLTDLQLAPAAHIWPKTSTHHHHDSVITVPIFSPTILESSNACAVQGWWWNLENGEDSQKTRYFNQHIFAGRPWMDSLNQANEGTSHVPQATLIKALTNTQYNQHHYSQQHQWATLIKINGFWQNMCLNTATIIYHL